MPSTGRRPPSTTRGRVGRWGWPSERDDAGHWALIALEAGSPRMRALVRTALHAGVPLAITAGALAQAWRASARQARLAQLLRASVTEVVALDRRAALGVGRLCAATSASDVVDVSVVACARDRGHAVITSDSGDLATID